MIDRSNIAELIDIVVLKAKALGWEEDQGSHQAHMDAEVAYLEAREQLDKALKSLLGRL